MSNESTAAPAANTDPLAGITIDPPAGGYPDHPLAAIFPMQSGEELAELAASIKFSGLRDDIVLFDGKVLDGRNRQAACFIAEVPPRYRTFDEGTEGSPASYVLDKNLRRRDLTASQKATAAAELMPILEREAAARQEASRFQAPAGDQTGAGYDAPREEDHAAGGEGEHGAGNSATTGENTDAGDTGKGDSTVDTSGDFSQVPPKKSAEPAKPAAAGSKGNSRAKAAAAVGVSERMVQDAKGLKESDPAKFQDVKSGKTTLGAAMKSAPSAGTKAATEYEQALEAIGKVCGDKMVKAIKEGAILRSRKEVIEYASLPDAKMQDIKGLVDIGWSVKKALHHKTETLLPTHQIMDGISRAAQAGGEYKQLIEAPETGSDWEITIKRKAHAAAPSGPAKPTEAAAGASTAPAAKAPEKAPAKKVTPVVFKPKAKAKPGASVAKGKKAATKAAADKK